MISIDIIIRFESKHVKTLVDNESKDVKKVIQNWDVRNTYNSHSVG